MKTCDDVGAVLGLTRQQAIRYTQRGDRRLDEPQHRCELREHQDTAPLVNQLRQHAREPFQFRGRNLCISTTHPEQPRIATGLPQFQQGVENRDLAPRQSLLLDDFLDAAMTREPNPVVEVPLALVECQGLDNFRLGRQILGNRVFRAA